MDLSWNILLSFTSGSACAPLSILPLKNQWNQIRVAGNASEFEIMVAKLSRWEAIADSPQILDLDLVGWVWTGSPKAFASVKHRQQHVTFIPDPLDSPKDHSKTSSTENAQSAWLVFHACILSCSEGLGGPLNSKPHNISKVHWWMLSKRISGQHATAHEKPKSIQKSGGGNASGSEIMVAKLSRWEAIADSPQILDLDLLGWVWTGSPKAFASVKHCQQHVTFIPDPLDSPKDHSKTSSTENAQSAWLVLHARILSCSEGLGGPLNSKPHNISKVHWWMLRKGISGQHATAHEKPKSTQKSGGGNASESEIMVAKLSRWEAIADSPQILDLDLLGWVWTGSPKAFASVKHRQQHVTFIPDPLDSPKDHSKTSSAENAQSAWLVFHARILSCSEGLGGPLNSKPHNISKVHWWMLRKGISGQHATTHEKPKSTQKSGGGNASGSEIMVAKLSRWEAIADSPQILDLDLVGWVWTGSPKAFASVKHRQQHVTFIPDPLDSPKDHSKTSSTENAQSAWLVFHARILSCSEGLGGPLNSKPHNISKVHWWMLSKRISGQHATAHEKPKSIQKSGGGNASGSEIMVAKLSRWEAIADSPQILDLDLLGWVWTGSPKAFASVKHRQQHVTFIPDPLDSPKDHSKTS